MERVLVAGGVQSLSMTPLMNWRIPIRARSSKFKEPWMTPTHAETPDAPMQDMSITVGWNTAQAAGHHPRGHGRLGSAVASACGRREGRG